MCVIARLSWDVCAIGQYHDGRFTLQTMAYDLASSITTAQMVRRCVVCVQDFCKGEPAANNDDAMSVASAATTVTTQQGRGTLASLRAGPSSVCVVAASLITSSTAV